MKITRTSSACASLVAAVLLCVVATTTVAQIINAFDDEMRVIPMAHIPQPTGLWIANDNAYITSATHQIFFVETQGRKQNVLAGTGERGHNDGPASQATFNDPRGIYVSNTGDVLIADYGNNAIRRIRGNNVTTVIRNINGPTSVLAINNECTQLLVSDREGNVFVVQNGPPNNDIEGAVPLLLRPLVSLRGSNMHATDELKSFQTAEGYSRTLRKSVWYKFTGDGQKYRFQTCQRVENSFSTQLSLFRARTRQSQDPKDTVNVASATTNCGRGSRITQCVQDGMQYYLAVSSYSSTQSGQFQLDVEVKGTKDTCDSECACPTGAQCGTSSHPSHCHYLCGECSGTQVCNTTKVYRESAVCVDSVRNSVCTQATSMSLVSGFALSVQANLVLARPHEELIGVNCFPWDVSVHTRAVWYKFMGNGNNIVASTCHTATEVNAIVRAFESPVAAQCFDIAESPQRMTCVGANTHFPCPLRASTGTTAFCTVKGTQYYLSVSTLYDEDELGMVGLKVIDSAQPCHQPPTKRDVVALLRQHDEDKIIPSFEEVEKHEILMQKRKERAEEQV